MRIHNCDVNLEYLKWKDNVSADALNRISPMQPLKDLQPEITIPVHQVIAEFPALSSTVEGDIGKVHTKGNRKAQTLKFLQHMEW